MPERAQAGEIFLRVIFLRYLSYLDFNLFLLS